VNDSEDWEIGALLGRFLGRLWWRWGGLFGYVFDWIVWVLVVGYVICKGVEGYVIVGWDVWA
jgi:hypothetical protein